MKFLMESPFDTVYLGLILALGLRLILENNKQGKSFGFMAIILGLGDAFHLVPRIISNLTINGFDKYVTLLSWGEFVTSVTMTLFYILFYYYYRNLSGDKYKKKAIWIYFLAAVRFIMILLPQNL